MTRINTNISAIQATHRLAFNQTDLATRLERLSTGLRINRGKDDPAGLIASETLRSEIRGIEQAIENSQRAINVISTAEGALNEISALLLDVRALINHAANDGAIGNDEKAADQLQIDSLMEAIDRIASTTQFGGEKLINGSMQYTVSGVAVANIADASIFGARVPENAYQNVLVEVAASAQTAQLVFRFTASAAASLSANATIELRGSDGTEIIALASGSNATTMAAAINANVETTGVSATVSGAGAATRILLNSREYGSDAMVSVKPIDGDFRLTTGLLATGTDGNDTGVDASVLINGQAASVNGLTAQLRNNGLDLKLELTSAFGTALGTTQFQITGGGALFQIGPVVNSNGQVSIAIPSVGTSSLGNAVLGYLYSLKGSGTNSIDSGNHQQAEKILVESINQVAVLRGRLGGLQRNQIETNINSQRISLENVKAAESAIRDADIAVEVSALTRSQILVQSTMTILGVANTLPQNALSLLG
jgi:flagellin